MIDRMFVALQHLLPRHWLTAVIYHIARIRIRVVKDVLIRGFIRIYKVDVDEVMLDIPADFRNFNEFFIRELNAESRPIDSTAASIVSPVDSTLSMHPNLRSTAFCRPRATSTHSMSCSRSTSMRLARMPTARSRRFTSRRTTIIACTCQSQASCSPPTTFRVISLA